LHGHRDVDALTDADTQPVTLLDSLSFWVVFDECKSLFDFIFDANFTPHSLFILNVVRQRISAGISFHVCVIDHLRDGVSVLHGHSFGSFDDLRGDAVRDGITLIEHHGCHLANGDAHGSLNAQLRSVSVGNLEYLFDSVRPATLSRTASVDSATMHPTSSASTSLTPSSSGNPSTFALSIGDSVDAIDCLGDVHQLFGVN
jgi:hypothetical protein